MNMHVAIPSKNIDASIYFYEVLGFQVTLDYQKEGQQLRIVRLEQDHQMIELMYHPKSGDVQFSQMPELQHIGFNVESLEATIDVLVAKGGKIVKGITDGVAVKRFAFVADPGGFPVELFEEK